MVERHVYCPGACQQYQFAAITLKRLPEGESTVLAQSLYDRRSGVGLSENVPQNPAGIRTDPPRVCQDDILMRFMRALRIYLYLSRGQGYLRGEHAV